MGTFSRKDDIIKKNICLDNNYYFLEFWETDINKNFDYVKKSILNKIEEINESTRNC